MTDTVRRHALIPDVHMALRGEGQLGAEQARAAVSASRLHHLPILQVAVCLADLTGTTVKRDMPHQLKRIVSLNNLRWSVKISFRKEETRGCRLNNTGGGNAICDADRSRVHPKRKQFGLEQSCNKSLAAIYYCKACIALPGQVLRAIIAFYR